ncbi:MAG: FecR family protein [Cyclobacteriaceae bacterium]|nr:FecR family protein [Cyclobacteriaceae bacterium]
MNYLIRALAFLGFFLLLFSCSEQSVSTDDSFDGVELPDGSIVWINHNSTIVYNEKFEIRRVHLDGEAYFKVVSSNKPFIVTTKLGEIKVLGTKFNINSTDDKLEVEVESGKVELEVDDQRKEVNRGQHVTYTKGSNNIEIREATYKFKIWLKELEVELKKLGKVISRETKKLGRELEKEGNKLNKKLKKLD